MIGEMGACGISPVDMRASPWDSIIRMFEGWRVNPPTHRMVAHYLGYKTGKEHVIDGSNESELDEFVRLYGKG